MLSANNSEHFSANRDHKEGKGMKQKVVTAKSHLDRLIGLLVNQATVFRGSMGKHCNIRVNPAHDRSRDNESAIEAR